MQSIFYFWLLVLLAISYLELRYYVFVIPTEALQAMTPVFGYKDMTIFPKSVPIIR